MQNSFYPKTIHDWNNLEQSIRDSPSLETFKRKLRDTKHHPPDWFYSNNRYSNSRLRMKCSPLNDDLFSQSHHVIESPQCPCGHARETALHFLLECPLFSNERTIMLNELLKINYEPTLSNLLYGDEHKEITTNIKAFELICNFLKETSRFDD